jgi:hypothetical protein
LRKPLESQFREISKPEAEAEFKRIFLVGGYNLLF